MANVQFSRLYDLILPYLPGAETGIVDLHIRRVLREFYRRTTLWRETFAFNTTLAQSYLLTPTTGSVHSIKSVTIDDVPIGVVPEHQQPTPAEVAASEPGVPRGWYSLYANQLSFWPSPEAGLPVSVVAVMTMSNDHTITEFPEETFIQYSEHLAAGVIGEMLAMPAKPWSQPKEAGRFGGIFVRKILEIRSRVRDGGQPNASTFTGPRFGA